MRAGPPGQEVHDVENDVLVVFATALPEIGTQLLKLREDLLARDPGLELVRDRAPEAPERLLGRKSGVELGGAAIATRLDEGRSPGSADRARDAR